MNKETTENVFETCSKVFEIKFINKTKFKQINSTQMGIAFTTKVSMSIYKENPK